MEIVFAPPPNINKILARFNLAGKTVVFSYGGKLYNPMRGVVEPHLMVHEEVHARQQKEFGGAEEWWNKYLSSDSFRLNQELEAYQVQYRYVSETCGRQIRRKFLRKIAKDLSGVMYGNIIDFDTAHYVIQNPQFQYKLNERQ